MKKRVYILTLAILFFIMLFILQSNNCSITGNSIKEENKIDSKILEKFNEGNEKIKVIVKLKENKKERGNEISELKKSKRDEIISEKNIKDKVKHNFNYMNSFSAELTQEEINNLVESNDIEGVYYDYPVKTFLQNSTDIINSTTTRNLQIDELNLTGIGQTVCILDTGINYSHTDLLSKYLGGYDYVNNDNNPSDDHGHGTHVAGIIAASGNILGVAPGTKIVAIKVLDSSGNGYSSDVLAGIDWCINNATKYNISVISMSLGCIETEAGYNSFCDSANPFHGCNRKDFTDSINLAVEKNISIVVATGNEGLENAIAAPACIKNSIRVGSTTKQEEISYFSNKWDLDMLIAPGGTTSGTSSCSPSSTPSDKICSTWYTGDYLAASGTSMAAPHTSGAITILNQYLNLTGRSMEPKQIENILNSTAKQIFDSEEVYYRIDVYSAILSIDLTPPNVYLSGPEGINNSVNQTFYCNVTDWQLKNITLNLYNSTGLVFNETKDISGISNETNFSVTNLTSDTYIYQCNSSDLIGNIGASETKTFTKSEITTTQIFPKNNYFTNKNEINFTCLSQTNEPYSLTNITLNLYNSTGLVFNETKDISGISNETNFSYLLINQGNYNWSCLTFNNASYSYSTENKTIVLDIISPSLNLTSYSSGNLGISPQTSFFYFNVSDNLNYNINCSLIVNNAILETKEIMNFLIINNITRDFTAGEYFWKINCSDLSGNSNLSQENNFSISSAQVVVSNEGGGGSSGSSTSQDAPSSVSNFEEKEEEENETDEEKEEEDEEDYEDEDETIKKGLTKKSIISIYLFTIITITIITLIIVVIFKTLKINNLKKRE